MLIESIRSPAKHALGWVSQCTAFWFKFTLSAYIFWCTSQSTMHFLKKNLIASSRTVAKISRSNFMQKNTSLTKVAIIL